MLSNDIVGGNRSAVTATTTAAAAAAAAAAAVTRGGRRRSVRAGRGPVHQIGPGQTVAVDVIVRLFAVAVRRLGRTVGRRFRLVAHLCNTRQTKNHTALIISTIVL